MTAALYARISTHEGKQTAETQLRELREFAGRHGWTIYREYVDQASGAKGRQHRGQLETLMQDAGARRFDVVIVWALDRFTREGVLKAFEHIEHLTASGVQFRSFTEPHFQTSGPHGELFIAIAAWMARQERERIRDRIRAGVARARANGATLGRRAVVVDLQRARDLMDRGASLRGAARTMHMSPTTLQRRLKIHAPRPVK